MNNETNEDTNLNQNSEEVVETNVNEETQETEESTDWQARARELEGRLKRAEKKLSRYDGDTPAKAPSKTGEFDYAQKAYLVANGVKGNDEMKLVKEIMANTGRSLDQVLESKYFTAELNEIREMKKTQDAIPSNSKRTTQSGKDSVEYWLAKGELPEDRELRSKVVKAKWKTSSSVNPFG
jgi:hypothetical protein